MQDRLTVMFRALGDPTRRRIFEFLRNSCCEVAIEESGDVRPMVGPTVGEVCCSVTGVEGATSRISFHLKELRNAGLINMERRGKCIICGIDRESIAVLADYLNQKPGARDDGCCE